MIHSPEELLEYVYPRRWVRDTLVKLFFVWLLIRIIRTVIYLTVGLAWLSSIPAATLFFLSGLVFGCAVMVIIVYRKSVTVKDIEQSKTRIAERKK